MPPKKGHVIYDRLVTFTNVTAVTFRGCDTFSIDLIYYFRGGMLKDTTVEWLLIHHLFVCLLAIVSHYPKCTTLKRASRISASIPSITLTLTWYVRLILNICWALRRSAFLFCPSRMTYGLWSYNEKNFIFCRRKFHSLKVSHLIFAPLLKLFY